MYWHWESLFANLYLGEGNTERDCFKFHWVEATNNDKIEIYHFARLVFGFTQSSFILKGTFDVHFDNYGQDFWEVVEKVRDDMYVDDLVNGGESINEVKKLKSESSLFREEALKLHRWYSNETILEPNDPCNTTELNFAKQQLGTKANKAKILGIIWDKQSDSFIIKKSNFRKRNILQTLASIYDH